MALITAQNLHLSFGGHPLLNGVNFSLEAGEKIALIGRNGEGKSTLFKILMGEILADEGLVYKDSSVKIAAMPQAVPHHWQGQVWDLVAEGLGDIQKVLVEYHHLSQKLDISEAELEQMGELQSQIDAANAWSLGQQVDKTLDFMELNGDADFAGLSGGQKRRVALAQALVQNPDLLLLDEPTNHLDIPSIEWLERFLKAYRGAFLLITHDRRFLQAVSQRILELDRGQLHSWNCDYQTYLKRKEAQLEAEEQQNALFDKRLAAEEVWIRQGIKARRTRNEGRVRALEALRLERKGRREQQGSAKASVNKGETSGKVVIQAEDISKTYGERTLFSQFSTLLMRGDKVGILGPNGAGKSTLIKILLDKEPPDSGKVKLGTNLEVAYFDQHRDELDPEKTVIDNLSPHSDFVTINGNDRHVISYLSDFLFKPDRCRQPVKALSGGERNRLLLAKVLARPSNFLIMDEPTNDLDLETLELLESLLVEYPGTLMIISHDRDFINQVVTSTIVMDGRGNIEEFVGGYDDWLRQSQRGLAQEEEGKNASKNDPKSTRPGEKKTSKAPEKPKNKGVKLSYKDQREYDALPERIEHLEAQIAQLGEQTSRADFYSQSLAEQQGVLADLSKLQGELDQAIDRWAQLEQMLNP